MPPSAAAVGVLTWLVRAAVLTVGVALGLSLGATAASADSIVDHVGQKTDKVVEKTSDKINKVSNKASSAKRSGSDQTKKSGNRTSSGGSQAYRSNQRSSGSSSSKVDRPRANRSSGSPGSRTITKVRTQSREVTRRASSEVRRHTPSADRQRHATRSTRQVSKPAERLHRTVKTTKIKMDRVVEPEPSRPKLSKPKLSKPKATVAEAAETVGVVRTEVLQAASSTLTRPLNRVKAPVLATVDKATQPLQPIVGRVGQALPTTVPALPDLPGLPDAPELPAVPGLPIEVIPPTTSVPVPILPVALDDVRAASGAVFAAAAPSSRPLVELASAISVVSSLAASMTPTATATRAFTSLLANDGIASAFAGSTALAGPAGPLTASTALPIGDPIGGFAAMLTGAGLPGTLGSGTSGLALVAVVTSSLLLTRPAEGAVRLASLRLVPWLRLREPGFAPD